MENNRIKMYMIQDNTFIIGCIAPLNLIYPTLDPELYNLLEKSFGRIEEIWPQTKCWIPPKNYAKEMGWNISTVIIIFQNIIRIKDLVKIKQVTMEIEDKFILSNCRQFNLNPGSIGKSGLFLASHKPSDLRKYIGNDVWLEKQLDNIKGRFFPLKNTFSEYSDPERIVKFDLLNKRKSFSYSDFHSNKNNQFYHQFDIL